MVKLRQEVRYSTSKMTKLGPLKVHKVPLIQHLLASKKKVICLCRFTIYTECKYGGPLGRRPGELHESEVSQSSMFCFVLKMLPQKTLALSSICSVLFRCAYELLCLWMRREGTEIFHRSPLRENSGSMQFFETEKRSSRSPGTKVCLLRFRIEDFRTIV